MARPGRRSRRCASKARALIAQLGVAIDPAAKVASLSPAQAQIVEIAKALSRDLQVLILDEPTAALTLTETEKLFEIVRRLAADGVSVIYVSHRLAEIFALCHSVTVLKDGKLAGTRNVAETTTEELIRLMVGRDVHLARSGSTPRDRRSRARGIRCQRAALGALGLDHRARGRDRLPGRA